VHVYFANGRSERADLLVGCDGFRSSVRTHLAPEVQPIYSGYYIWRGAPNESDLSPDTRRTMFPYYSFFLGDQLQALGYPISGGGDRMGAGPPTLQFGLVSRRSRSQVKTDVRGRSWSRIRIRRAATTRAQRFDFSDACRSRDATAAAISRLSAAYRPAVFHTGLRLLLSQIGVRPSGTGRRCGLDTASSHRFWRIQGRCGSTGSCRSAFQLRRHRPGTYRLRVLPAAA